MSAELWNSVKKVIGIDAYEEEDDVTEDYSSATSNPELAKPASRTMRPSQGSASVPGHRMGGNISVLPTSTSSEVVVIEPRSFDEALGILDNLRTRKAVILNLLGLAPDQSQRLVDFVSGACHALDGHQEKIGESIFLFTPSNVVINTFHSDRDWMGNQQPKDLFWRVR